MVTRNPLSEIIENPKVIGSVVLGIFVVDSLIVIADYYSDFT